MIYNHVETLARWSAGNHGWPTESAEAVAGLAAVFAAVLVTMAGTYLSGFLPANSGDRADP